MGIEWRLWDYWVRLSARVVRRRIFGPATVFFAALLLVAASAASGGAGATLQTAGGKKAGTGQTGALVQKVTVSPDPVNPLPADGHSAYTFTAYLVDMQGQPLPAGVSVADLGGMVWAPPSGNGLVLTPQDAVTRAGGIVRATLTSTVVVDNVQVSAKLGSHPAVPAEKAVSFVSANPNSGATIREVTVEPNPNPPLPADGSSAYTFTAYLVNENGQALQAGISLASLGGLKWSPPSGNGLTMTLLDSATGPGGTARASLTSDAGIDNVQVSAQLGSEAAVNADKTVSFSDVAGSTKANDSRANAAGSAARAASAEQVGAAGARQMGSFVDRANAERFAAELRAKHSGDVRVESARVHGRNFYRVLVEPAGAEPNLFAASAPVEAWPAVKPAPEVASSDERANGAIRLPSLGQAPEKRGGEPPRPSPPLPAPAFLQMMASNDPGRAAAAYATGRVNEAAFGGLQSWLSRYGTAEVSLGVDERGRFLDGSLDFLLPLYDNKDSWLLFSQLGYLRRDNRDTINLGVGTRYFVGDWMYGANAFFDRDITGYNSRWGIGTELWTDYLKLAANGYFRVTDWHRSIDLEDYDERPANGFDLNADAYLPSFPQLGFNLKYEQYYGDSVALFGLLHRQKDPRAVAFGLNYTPFPLLTMGVRYRQGRDDLSDTETNIQFNYQFGVPWSQQVDPNAVSGRRSLAGSRYDLVERNKQIVLEYRRRIPILLTLPPTITGQGGETKPMGATVVAEYGAQNIEWQAPELFASGGAIDGSGADYNVTMPAYRFGGTNTYAVVGVAVDTRGNKSEPAETSVVVQAPEISPDRSSSVASPQTLPADGTSTGIITITVRDTNGEPVTGLADELQLGSGMATSAVVKALAATSAANGEPTLGKVTEQGDGVYQATITAGTQAGILTITPRLPDLNMDLPQAQVHFFTEAVIQKVTVTPDPVNPLPADGHSAYTFTAYLVDMQGQPLPAGMSVAGLGGMVWAPPSGNGLVLTPQDALTRAGGIVRATLTSTVVVDNVQVSAKLGSHPAVPAEKAVSFVSANPNSGATIREVTVEPNPNPPLQADGSSAYTFTAYLVNENGQALQAGISLASLGGLKWSPPSGNGLTMTLLDSATGPGGTARASLTSDAGIDNVQVSAQLGSEAAVNADEVVSFTTVVHIDRVEVSPSGPLYADGSQAYTYTAYAVDAGNRPLPSGYPLTGLQWSTLNTHPGLVLTPGSSTTGDQGTVTATLTSTKAANDVNVGAQLPSMTAPKYAAPVDFLLAPRIQPGSVAASPENTILAANGTTPFTITATVVDAAGDPVASTPVSALNLTWDTDPASESSKVVFTPETSTDTSGKLTGQVTSNNATNPFKFGLHAGNGADPMVYTDSTLEFQPLPTTQVMGGLYKKGQYNAPVLKDHLDRVGKDYLSSGFPALRIRFVDQNNQLVGYRPSDSNPVFTSTDSSVVKVDTDGSAMIENAGTATYQLVVDVYGVQQTYQIPVTVLRAVFLPTDFEVPSPTLHNPNVTCEQSWGYKSVTVDDLQNVTRNGLIDEMALGGLGYQNLLSLGFWATSDNQDGDPEHFTDFPPNRVPAQNDIWVWAWQASSSSYVRVYLGTRGAIDTSDSPGYILCSRVPSS